MPSYIYWEFKVNIEKIFFISTQYVDTYTYCTAISIFFLTSVVNITYFVIYKPIENIWNCIFHSCSNKRNITVISWCDAYVFHTNLFGKCWKLCTFKTFIRGNLPEIMVFWIKLWFQYGLNHQNFDILNFIAQTSELFNGEWIIGFSFNNYLWLKKLRFILKHVGLTITESNCVNVRNL